MTARQQHQFSKRVEVQAMPNTEDGYLLEKWGIDGMAVVDRDLQHARTQVKTAGKYPELVSLASEHEMGHLEFFEDRLTNEPHITFDDIMASDIWFTEVDAWLRALDALPPLTEKQGQFVLDCLYSYAKSYASDEEWWEAKDAISAHAKDDQTEVLLSQYKPMEPPVGTPPPSPGFDVQDLPEGDPEERERQQERADEQRAGGTPPLLLSPEGLAAASMGREWLRDWVMAMGHGPLGDRPLPALVEAMLKGGE
jgi:hypothetical protein